MRPEIKLSVTEQNIFNDMDFIINFGYPKKLNHIPDLSLDEILTLCSLSFGIEAGKLVGKLDHNKAKEKIAKQAFIAGMYFYSNMGPTDCKTFANYNGDTKHGCWPSLNYERIRNPSIIRFFVELSKACPRRLKMLSVADYSKADGVTDMDGASPLTTYQVTRVPIRDLAWFKNNGKVHTVLGFNINKPGECKLIKANYTQSNDVFFRMQNQGYRFIKFEDRFNFKGIHHICDKCVNKNNCINRLRGWYGGSGENFECYEEVPGASYKVPLELLYPMKHYQLQ